jgi:GT2 family glycosyltransferase
MENCVRDDFIEEIKCQFLYESINSKKNKDICIVVHNQLSFTKKCIDSIYENTTDFNIYVYDNNSTDDTFNYLNSIKEKNFFYYRKEKNEGFILPNNFLVACGQSDYVILLNNDTIVHRGWDTALLGWLENNPQYKAVGYLGGLLDENCKGTGSAYGDAIDYVCGWCLCFDRSTYKKIGLFDSKNLSFAYGEDADFCLRLRESGSKIRSLHLGLVEHFGNATIKEVSLTHDCKTSFDLNHDYLKIRWNDYLNNDRVLIKKNL